MKKIKKNIKEAIYDPGDTVPVRGVVQNDEDPVLAIKYAEEHNLGPNDTIINTFSQAEKEELLRMIKAGEFNQLEAAVLHALMSEAATLQDVGAMIGAVSRRTHGEPTSKPAAIKEINRILKVVKKRSKAIIGTEVDLSRVTDWKREEKKNAEFRKKKARQAEKYAREQEKEFYRLLKELHAEERKRGLPRSKYYVRKFVKPDKDISKMRKFGGTPDQNQ